MNVDEIVIARESTLDSVNHSRLHTLGEHRHRRVALRSRAHSRAHSRSLAFPNTELPAYNDTLGNRQKVSL